MEPYSIAERGCQRLTVLIADRLTVRRVKTYALLLPLIALTVLLVDCLVKGSLWFVSKGDFILYYTGGRYVIEGRLGELYDFAAQEIFQSKVLGLKAPRLTPFNHPPFTALFYAPFALSGFTSGLILWLAAGVAALFFGWKLLRQELPGLSPYSPFRLTLLSFCFYPTIAWILANQNSTFTFLIYTATYVQLRRRRDLAAGAILGCLLYKPQLALTPAFILLVKGRGKAIIGFLFTSLLLLGIGFLLSPKAMLDYARVLPQIAELPFLPGYPVEKMHNFYGFWLLLLEQVASRRMVETAAVVCTTGGLLAVAAWWHSIRWDPTTDRWNLTFAFTLALGLLISPHLMIYDLTALLLPIAIVCAVYPQQESYVLDGGPLLVWTALVWVGVFVSTDATSALLGATGALGFPKMAAQLSVPIICAWTLVGRSLLPQQDDKH